MALIKLSSIGITNLSGKAGGSVFAHNRGGSYVRNFAVPSNPQTAAQMQQRSIFGGLATAWRQLTQEQREAWKNAAVSFPYIDRFGDEKVMSGENLFISLNRNLRVAGNLTPLNSPPTPQGVDAVNELVVDSAVNAGTFTLLLDAQIVGNDAATTVFAIYAAPPVSAGISYVKNRMRLIGTATETDLETEFDITADYQAVFADASVGSKVIVRVEPINQTTGERGALIQSAGITADITP